MTELAGAEDILDQNPMLEQRPKSVTMHILINLSPICCYFALLWINYITLSCWKKVKMPSLRSATLL